MRTKTIIGLLITVAIVAGLLKVIPPSQVIPYLKSTDPVYFALACLANFMTIAIRARRWQMLISHFKRVPYGNTFRLLTIGNAVNFAVPLRAGEAMRSYSLASRWSMSKRESLSTVLVDRSFDVVSFGLLLLVATTVFELPDVMSSKTYGLALSSLALAASFPLVAWLGRTIRQQPKGRFSGELQRRIALKLEPLARGYTSLTSKTAIVSVFLSIAAWIVHIFVALLVSRAVGVSLPISALVMAVFTVYAAYAVPLTPANIGVFQIAFLFPLSAYGFDRMSTFAVATVFQAAMVIPVAVLGLILINHERQHSNVGATPEPN